jgi:hypothetical protein
MPSDLKDNIDYSNIMLESRPGKDIEEINTLRKISSLGISKIFDKGMPSTSNKKYKDNTDIVIRNFLRVLLKGDLEEDGVSFANYKSIIDFIKGFKSSIRISKSSLSHLKNTATLKPVPFTKETAPFVQYVTNKFPKFVAKKIYR